MTAPCPFCGDPLPPWRGRGRKHGACYKPACRAALRNATRTRLRYCDGCGQPGHQLRPSGKPALALCPACYVLDAPERDGPPPPYEPPPAPPGASGCGPEPRCRRGAWCASCRNGATPSRARTVRFETPAHT